MQCDTAHGSLSDATLAVSHQPHAQSVLAHAQAQAPGSVHMHASTCQWQTLAGARSLHQRLQLLEFQQSVGIDSSNRHSWLHHCVRGQEQRGCVHIAGRIASNQQWLIVCGACAAAGVEGEARDKCVTTARRHGHAEVS